jgi:hypothetical protein
MPICDYWILIDNSEGPFHSIAEGLKVNELEINDKITWNKLKIHANG